VRGLKVPGTELADYVERLTRRFVAAREPDESFAQWAHRADEEALS
jgi:sulfite reductase (ferredoxin)